jgi:hypothetical protein
MEQYELQTTEYPTRFYLIKGLNYDFGYIDPETGRQIITRTEKFISESIKQLGIQNILTAGFKLVPTELTLKFEITREPITLR